MWWSEITNHSRQQPSHIPGGYRSGISGCTSRFVWDFGFGLDRVFGLGLDFDREVLDFTALDIELPLSRFRFTTLEIDFGQSSLSNVWKSRLASDGLTWLGPQTSSRVFPRNFDHCSTVLNGVRFLSQDSSRGHLRRSAGWERYIDSLHYSQTLTLFGSRFTTEQLTSISSWNFSRTRDILGKYSTTTTVMLSTLVFFHCFDCNNENIFWKSKVSSI